MSIIRQLISGIFTYIFAFISLYIWQLSAPYKWFAIIPFILLLLSYIKFTFGIVIDTAENICSKNVFSVVMQILLIVANVFILFYTISNFMR